MSICQCWMLNVECWMLNVECWMLNVVCWMLNVECWMIVESTSLLIWSLMKRTSVFLVKMNEFEMINVTVEWSHGGYCCCLYSYIYIEGSIVIATGMLSVRVFHKNDAIDLAHFIDYRYHSDKNYEIFCFSRKTVPPNQIKMKIYVCVPSIHFNSIQFNSVPCFC